MTEIAACLKTQYGDNTPYIQRMVGDDVQMSSDNFDTYEVVGATLLQYYFMPPKEMLGLLPKIEEYPSWFGTINVDGTNKTMASFDESSIRKTLKSLYANTPVPLKWGMTMEEAIDKLRLNTLSQFVYENQPLNTNVDLYYDWYTLTIYRCTQSDIDSLNADGRSYLDMFDYLKELIVNGQGSSELEGKGYSKARYDEISDTIIFHSNFALEIY